MSGMLDHSPEEIIRDLLVDLGLGVVPVYEKNPQAGQQPVYTGQPWPVFAGGEPDKPDSAITVKGTTGVMLGRIQIDGSQSEDHGIQVLVRAAGAAVGIKKLNRICIALDKDVTRRTLTIGGSDYLVHRINRTSGPLSLGRESPQSSRRLFTANMLVAVEQTNSDEDA